MGFRRQIASRLILALSALAAMAHAPGALAAYRDCASGDLLTATCWSPDGVPSLLTAEIGHSSFASPVTATMTSGSFVPSYLYVGTSGYNGTINHTGGTIGSTTTTFDIRVGSAAGLTGTYNLSGTGIVNVRNSLWVGGTGTGIVNQTSATSSVNVVRDLSVDGHWSGGSGTYNLSAGTLTVGGFGFYSTEQIGAHGIGSFVQTGGTHNASTSTIFLGVGTSGITTGVGSYELSGGSLNAYGLRIGQDSSGNFSQTGGTSALQELSLTAAPGGSATYNLAGTGSLWVGLREYLGGRGANVFNQSGGTYTVNIGATSLFGYNGNFTYNQTGGTRTSDPTLTLGATTGYSAVYNLRGGTLNANASQAISNSNGTGTLNIDGGTLAVGSISGSVNVDVLNIGSTTGYTGSHTVSGNRSITAFTENVGKGGSGSLTQTGGNHTVIFDLTVAAEAGSSGTYNLQGGNLTVGLPVNGSPGTYTGRLVNNDTVNYSGGTLVAAINNLDTLNILGGGTRSLARAVTNNGVMDVAAGTTAEFNALVNGAGAITGDGTSVFNGGFSPGNSPALVTIAGDAVFGTGNTLLFELAGLTPGSQFDVLDIGGDAFLGGVLDIDLLSGFNPVAGNSFDILMAEVLHGAFGSALLPTLDPGLRWDLQYLLDPTGDDVVRLSVQLAPAVPVPAAVWMFGSALLALGVVRRRGATPAAVR